MANKESHKEEDVKCRDTKWECEMLYESNNDGISV